MQEQKHKSHPTWVRGLKPPIIVPMIGLPCRTLRGCVDWNKGNVRSLFSWRSRTLRGCVDWNIKGWLIHLGEGESHPTWVRGLKIGKGGCVLCGGGVAPYVGAWIETLKAGSSILAKESRTLRGCVDWNLWCLSNMCALQCRTLRGCVDWNAESWCYKKLLTSRTLRGCVDWNSNLALTVSAPLSRTLRGCVDWNRQSLLLSCLISGRTLRGCVDWNSNKGRRCLKRGEVAPYVGAWIETHMVGNRQILEGRTLRGCVDWNLHKNNFY